MCYKSTAEKTYKRFLCSYSSSISTLPTSVPHECFLGPLHDQSYKFLKDLKNKPKEQVVFPKVIVAWKLPLHKHSLSIFIYWEKTVINHDLWFRNEVACYGTKTGNVKLFFFQDETMHLMEAQKESRKMWVQTFKSLLDLIRQ